MFCEHGATLDEFFNGASAAADGATLPSGPATAAKDAAAIYLDRLALDQF